MRQEITQQMTRIHAWILALGLSLGVVFGVVFAPLAQANGRPDEMARNATEEVVNIVRQDRDIRAGNKKKIHALVEAKILPHFDFEHMTRLAVGKNWREASVAQQSALTEEFKAMLVRTYAASISSIIDYKFEYKPLRMNPGDSEVVVSFEASKSGSPAIPVDYRVEKQAAGWKVYDIMVDGVSLITVYRNSFNKEIKKGGVDGLIDTLRRRNQKA